LRSEQFIGQIVEVLVEKISKKSTEEFSGRNSQSITVVFPKENYKIRLCKCKNNILHIWNIERGSSRI
jgi:tRNA A37 methylthiotransferase MiaB